MNYRYKGLDIFATAKYERYNYVQNSVLTQKAFVDTLWTQTNSLDVEGIADPLTIIGV